jgi:uncharacterized protein YjbI with pentapeptide repeats
MRGAVLTNGGFVGASFASSDLTLVSAFNADFLSADFTDARLANADFRGVRLLDAALVCTDMDNMVVGPAQRN